jgi:hypothetical protein
MFIASSNVSPLSVLFTKYISDKSALLTGAITLLSLFGHQGVEGMNLIDIVHANEIS